MFWSHKTSSDKTTHTHFVRTPKKDLWLLRTFIVSCNDREQVRRKFSASLERVEFYGDDT